MILIIGSALNWPSIQLNIHRTENCAITELGWGRGAFSHDSVDSGSELFHEYTTFPQLFLNWPSIQLNIHTTKNCDDDDDSSDWKIRFGAFSLTDSQHIAWNILFVLSFVLPFVLYFIWKLINGWSDYSNIYISKRKRKKSLRKSILHFTFNTQNLLIEGDN